MKVLIAAPTARQKDYCFNEYYQQLIDIEYPEKHVFMVDNSDDEDYVKKLMSKGIPCGRVTRGGKTSTEFIAESQNLIRQYALEHNYDYVFMLESDVFIPKGLLAEMVSHKNPVHNVTYFVKGGDQTSICLQMIQTMNGRAVAKMLPLNLAHLAFTGEIKPFTDYIIDYNTTLMGSGVGCSLIHREVLQAVEFRTDVENDKKTGKLTFPDTFFHLDVNKLGIANVFDSTIIAQHKPSPWIAREMDVIK
jgi:hypothetical protein